MRPQKITFGEMREMGLRGVLIYCADYHCSHSVAVSADLVARRSTAVGYRATLCLRRLRQARARSPAGLQLGPACGSGDNMIASSIIVGWLSGRHLCDADVPSRRASRAPSTGYQPETQLL
jgi:hypothetical protein